MKPQPGLVSSSEFRLSAWTLSFLDLKHEQEFEEIIERRLHLPLTFRVLTYLAIIMQLGYRVLAIISIYTGGLIQTGTLTQELASMAFIVGCLLLEVLLRWLPRWKKLRGFCLYACLPIANIAGVFYTQKAPHFGLL